MPRLTFRKMMEETGIRGVKVALSFMVPIPAAADSPVPPPAAPTLDGVPTVPTTLRIATQPNLQNRSAAVVDWNPATHGLVIATRFGNSTQLRELARPLGDRHQISFEEEPNTGGSFGRRAGAPFVVVKDIGCGEFFQLYALASGRLTLLTDGKSPYEGAVWDREGRHLAQWSEDSANKMARSQLQNK